jgi:hypothetical protein
MPVRRRAGERKNLKNRITGFPVGRLKMMTKKLYYVFRGKNFLEDVSLRNVSGEAGIFYFQLLKKNMV